jgi:hypothetical protein
MRFLDEDHISGPSHVLFLKSLQLMSYVVHVSSQAAYVLRCYSNGFVLSVLFLLLRCCFSVSSSPSPLRPSCVRSALALHLSLSLRLILPLKMVVHTLPAKSIRTPTFVGVARSILRVEPCALAMLFLVCTQTLHMC